MKRELQYRNHSLDGYEIRSNSDGRTLCGIAVPFDTYALVPHPNNNERTANESFTNGAFTRTIQQRAQKVKAKFMHNQSVILGAATLLEQRQEGLYVELRISKTREGDEALELVKDGALDSFSIGYIPLQTRWSDKDTFTVTEAFLAEVSVVDFPAYKGADIMAVRSELTVPNSKDLDYWKAHFLAKGVKI